MVANAVDSILLGLRPGETVLVEYSSVSSPELLLYFMISKCSERGVQVLIDDISDTFSEYVTRLDLMGLDTEGILKVPIIKIGGSRELGNVLGRVEVDKYALDFKYYWAIHEKYRRTLLKGVICNPVLGIHKLFATFSEHDAIRLVRNISTFLGKKSRFALYFINLNVMEKGAPDLLSLLEETASTVLRWDFDGSEYRLSVIKAANYSIVGSKAYLSFRDIAGM